MKSIFGKFNDVISYVTKSPELMWKRFEKMNFFRKVGVLLSLWIVYDFLAND